MTWKGIWNILPATRKIGILNGVLMFMYDIFARSYISMVSETLTMISAASALIYFAKQDGVQKSESVAETRQKK